MEAVFFFFIGTLFIIAILLIKYLNGDYTYSEQIIELTNNSYTVERTYHNGRVIIFKHKMTLKT